MKKIFLASICISVVLLTFLGCSKNNGANNTTLVSIFKFSANGVAYEWDGSLFDNTTTGSKIEKTGQTTFGCPPLTPVTAVYQISARNGTSECYFSFKSSTVNLTTGVYLSTFSSSGCSGSSIEWTISPQSIYGYPIQSMGDMFSTTITNVSNGYASGTFNGTIRNHPSTTKDPINISGEFQNVRYIQ